MHLILSFFLNKDFPFGNIPQELDFTNDLILKDSCPGKTLNFISFLDLNNFPFINRVKLYFFEKLLSKRTSILSFNSTPNEKNKYGCTKNLKHAADEIGLPGSPKNEVCLLNFANVIGFPGLIKTPLKKDFNLNFFITDGMKSNLPAETAPDVITKSVLLFKFFFISLSKKRLCLSLRIFFFNKFHRKVFEIRF